MKHRIIFATFACFCIFPSMAHSQVDDEVASDLFESEIRHLEGAKQYQKCWDSVLEYTLEAKNNDRAEPPYYLSVPIAHCLSGLGVYSAAVEMLEDYFEEPKLKMSRYFSQKENYAKALSLYNDIKRREDSYPLKDFESYSLNYLAKAMYQNGEVSGAIDAFEKSAEMGNSESEYKLGTIYLIDGKYQDFDLAATWLKKAALNNHVEASRILVHQYSRDGKLVGTLDEVERQKQVDRWYVHFYKLKSNPENP